MFRCCSLAVASQLPLDGNRFEHPFLHKSKPQLFLGELEQPACRRTKANAPGAAFWHGWGTEKSSGVGWGQGNHHTACAGGVGWPGCRGRDAWAGQGQSANQSIFCCSAAAILLHLWVRCFTCVPWQHRAAFPFVVRHILTWIC